MTHVDDEAIFTTGADNDELVANIEKVANIVDKNVSAHGMAVNWDPGETEVIVLWSSKRTRACQHECNVDGIPGVLLENGRVCRFVPKYKHLGSLVSATPSSAVEIRERIKKATRAFHALRQESIFCCMRSTSNYDPGCSMRLSCLFCCTTPRLGCPRVQVRWSDAYEEFANSPEHPFQARYVSDAEVLKVMRMPSVLSLLASRRVGYAMSLCRCPLDPLLGHLSVHDEHPDQWSSLVFHELLVISKSPVNLGWKPSLKIRAINGLRGCPT